MCKTCQTCQELHIVHRTAAAMAFLRHCGEQTHVLQWVESCQYDLFSAENAALVYSEWLAWTASTVKHNQLGLNQWSHVKRRILLGDGA